MYVYIHIHSEWKLSKILYSLKEKLTNTTKAQQNMQQKMSKMSVLTKPGKGLQNESRAESNQTPTLALTKRANPHVSEFIIRKSNLLWLR